LEPISAKVKKLRTDWKGIGRCGVRPRISGVMALQKWLALQKCQELVTLWRCETTAKRTRLNCAPRRHFFADDVVLTLLTMQSDQSLLLIAAQSAVFLFVRPRTRQRHSVLSSRLCASAA
jgi:hypothetical protein